MDRTPVALGLLILAVVHAVVSWTIASPTGASPDEPAHMTYAWGLSTGQGPGGPDPDCVAYEQCPVTFYDVPADLIPVPSCYRFDTSVTVACRSSVDSPAGTAVTRYPPPFYLLTGFTMRAGLSSGASPEIAGLLARLAAGLLSASLLLGAVALSIRRSVTQTAGALITVTPTALFLAASVNPNGVEIAAAIAVAVVLAAQDRAPTPATIGLFFWGSFWLAWARPVGWLWLGLLLSLGFALRWLQSDRSSVKVFAASNRAFFAVSALSGLPAIGWFVYAVQAHATSADEGVTLPENDSGRFVALLLRFGDMGTEALGALGWLDTTIPALLRTLLLVSIIGSFVVAWHTTRSGPDRRVCAGYFIVVLILIGVLMDRQSFLWQGRYVLPPLASGFVLLLARADGSLRRPIIGFADLSWLVATTSAFWLYARYAFGLTRGPRLRRSQLRHRRSMDSNGRNWPVRSHRPAQRIEWNPGAADALAG